MYAQAAHLATVLIAIASTTSAIPTTQANIEARQSDEVGNDVGKHLEKRAAEYIENYNIGALVLGRATECVHVFLPADEFGDTQLGNGDYELFAEYFGKYLEDGIKLVAPKKKPSVADKTVDMPGVVGRGTWKQEFMLDPTADRSYHNEYDILLFFDSAADKIIKIVETVVVAAMKQTFAKVGICPVCLSKQSCETRDAVTGIAVDCAGYF